MTPREKREAFDIAAIGWFLGTVIGCVLVAASCVASLAHGIPL